MKKYIKPLLITLFFFIIIGIPLAIYDGLKGNPIRSWLMVNATKEHLLNEGYKEEEILEIDATYNMKRNTERIKGTIAYVTFQDEPNEEYVYVQLRDSDEIKQSCEYFNRDTNAYEVEYTEDRKHMIKGCISYH